MAGRGPQSFKKRQKEQQRKEKQEEKRAKRLDRKRNPHLYVGIPDDDTSDSDFDDASLDRMPLLDEGKST